MFTWTLVILLARVLDVRLGTVRVQFIVRRKKPLAALTGFIEVLVFILIVSRVIQDIQHWPYVLAYAAGFAAGTLLGIRLSERLSRQVVQETVISNERSSDVETAIREAGFALTRYGGARRDGPVDVLDVVCTDRGVSQLIHTVTEVVPRACLHTHELAALKGGHVYGIQSKL